MKTIQLNGGPFDGKRMVVPIYSAELSFPDKRSDGAFGYCPQGKRTPDGLEIWELAWATGVGEFGFARSEFRQHTSQNSFDRHA
ncbi:MAG TPA: hypothetical protein VFO28_12770 [Burkholderiaceae bacterium]|nr:hypothetical protein [Burkholderiaceae bacterium]